MSEGRIDVDEMRARRFQTVKLCFRQRVQGIHGVECLPHGSSGSLVHLSRASRDCDVLRRRSMKRQDVGDVTDAAGQTNDGTGPPGVSRLTARL